MNESGWFQPPWRARNEGEGVPEGSMPFAKGPSQKNRDVSWRVSAASLVNGAPFYYTREHHPSTILISPSLSPRAAYGSPLFLSLSLSLSSRTNKSKHYRPCREYLLREDECTPGQNARNVFHSVRIFSGSLRG